MVRPKERFVVDGTGQRVAVLIDIDDYERLLEELEELESIRAYDAAMAAEDDEAVPLDDALAEIESLPSRLPALHCKLTE